MSKPYPGRDSLETNDLDALLELLRSSPPGAPERGHAVLALCKIASCETGQVAIREAGGIPLLVCELPGYDAAKALQRLAIDVHNENAIREAGGISALVAQVADGRASFLDREAACGALQNLASEDNTANHTAIRDCGGLEALAELLSEGEGSRAAAKTLKNLRTDSTNAAALDVLAASGKFPGASRDACDFGRHEMHLPSNWDNSIRFTDRFLHEGVLDPSSWSIQCALFAPPRPTDTVRIDFITRADHPCVGQRGLFAAVPLCRGATLLRYTGVFKRRSARDENQNSDYRYALKNLAGCDIDIDIDAEHAGNESRFINDYRGTGAARPNVQFTESRVAGNLEVWVEVTQAIDVNEEILITYGSNYF